MPRHRASKGRSPPSINPLFSSPDAPALGEGLLLRDDSGRLIAAVKMVALETARPFAAQQAPSNTHVEISTGPFELSPQTHYQLLSRVAVCSAQDGVRVACLQEEYVAIGDMTTGTEFDRQGPMIASVTNGTTAGQCLAALPVVASDDHATAGALRFAIDTLAYLGPDVVLPTPISLTDEGRTTVSVVPIDPSNNEGPAFEIDVEACYLPPTDGPPPGPIRRLPRPAEADSSASGCALAPRPAPSAMGVVALFLLLTLLPIARRRFHPDPG
ncbi:MAG: hypothetical protein ABI895_32745 [Deltaproteobacteria bacterium]